METWIGSALMALMFGSWFTFAVLRPLRRHRQLQRIFSQAGQQLGVPALGLELRGPIEGMDVLVKMGTPLFRSFHEPESVKVEVDARSFPTPEVVQLVRSRLPLDGPRLLVEVEEGLSLEVAGEPGKPSDLTGPVEHLRSVVKQVLAAPIPELLFDNLAPGNGAELRLRSLQALARYYRKSEPTAWGLNAALTDPDPELRFVAALETSDDLLTAFVLDEQTPADLRSPALQRLQARLSYEQLSPVLGKVLFLQDDPCRIRAVALIGSHADQTHLGAVRQLAPQVSGELAAAVAITLEKLECRDEAPWIELLGSTSMDAQFLAMQALGKCGSERAVEPLLALASRGEDKAVARESIRAIQSRLVGAEAGGVSIVQDADAGAVSLAAPERDKV
ncbi:MAG: HEAT repeat domain-containing protein [Myxococcales bacterium]